ncbi:MAG: hypothetical protein M3139_19450 [Bacteroidota bacterium]|nr:hypothetical protein [Bacteroidota bacterium]
MAENKNDQYSPQTNNNSNQQSTQPTSDSDPDKINDKFQEIEEWDVVVSDERRPQFRCSENYGRRNFHG